MRTFLIDFVFDNKPDITMTIKADDETEAIYKAKLKLTQESKDLLLKTYCNDQNEDDSE